MDENIAISRLKQGDPGGLESLVRDYQVRAVYSAYMIVNDRSQAEDVAQMAFVRVAEKIQQFDETRSFAPWFFRIVINEAVRIAKQQYRNVPLDDDPDDNVNAMARWLLDPQPPPEKQVEFKETQQVISNALKRLKPEQRAVVVMRYYLEMSEIDMSIRLERPVSTVKWWLHTAREHLKMLLSSSQSETSGEKHEKR